MAQPDGSNAVLIEFWLLRGDRLLLLVNHISSCLARPLTPTPTLTLALGDEDGSG